MNCQHCGRFFEGKKMGPAPKYCTDACKQAAYRERSTGSRYEMYTDAEVKQVLREARAIPGGGYPSGSHDYDRKLDPFLREAGRDQAHATYGGAAASKAFVDWVATGSKRWSESKALVLDASGSTLIPLDMAVDIATVAREAGTIRSLANARPTVNAKQRVGMLSAATVGWGRLEGGTSATDAAVAASSPAQDIDVWDVLALATVGVDELDDTPEAVRAAIVEAIGIGLGEAEDLALAAGSGTNQPKGLTLAANVARVPAGQKTTAAVSATPVLADVIGLPWKCPTKYRAKGVWLMSEDAAPKIAALTYATGSGIMPNAGQGLGPLGYPFAVVPGLPSMATAGATDPSVWFVNVQAAYRVVDRGPITVQRLTETYVERGLVGLLVKRRVGGDLIRPDAAAVYLL